MRPQLSHDFVSLSLLLASFTFVACASAPPRAQDPPRGEADAPVATQDSTITSLIEAHNKERAKEGLPPLKPNEKLQAAAERHARDMAEHRIMSHEGSDKSTPQDRIAEAGYRSQRTGENVAYGQRTPDRLMATWMDSPPHKKNILGQFSEVGAAVATAEDGTPYWSVDLGLPWPDLDPAEAATRLVEAINRERSRAGKPVLETNALLEVAARRQARDMGEQRTLDPKPSDHLTPFRRVEKSGYRFAKIAQNVAQGHPTPEELLSAWMKDKGSKGNVLGTYSQVGAGYAAAKDGTPYWSVLFGIPLGR
jgi:uncharacterized protein YkwD